MGYKLRREVADTLPSWVKENDRLVVLEFADQARDETRIAYGSDLLATVAHRCGLPTTKAVGKVLGRLAERGIELRVQLAREDGTPMVDARGRKVFAHSGKSTTYRIPVFGTAAAPESERDAPDDGPLPGSAGPAMVPPPGDHSPAGSAPAPGNGPLPGGASASDGPPAGGQWSPPGGSMVPPPGVDGPLAGGPLSSLSPHLPSLSPQSVVADARAREALAHLTATYRLTDEEAAAVWEGAQRMARRPIDSPVPYLRAMAAKGALANLVQAAQLAGAPRTEDQADEFTAPDHAAAPHERTVAEAIGAATLQLIDGRRRDDDRATSQPPILSSVNGGQLTEAEREAMREETERLLAPFREKLHPRHRRHG